MRVDGTVVAFEKILGDSTRRELISDEGELTAFRYDK
jgi:hypothetical protein